MQSPVDVGVRRSDLGVLAPLKGSVGENEGVAIGSTSNQGELRQGVVGDRGGVSGSTTCRYILFEV